MRAVTAVQIGRSIVATGVGDVGVVNRGDRIAQDRSHAAGEVLMDGRGISGVETGVSDSNDFTRAG